MSGGKAPLPLAALGAAIGIPGFLVIILSSFVIGPVLFIAGTPVGLGAGLFGHATLTATIRTAPEGRVGLSLALGVQYGQLAGLGVLLAGLVRDVFVGVSAETGLRLQTPYNIVFGIEIVFLVAAVLVALPLFLKRDTRPAVQRETNPVEVS